MKEIVFKEKKPNHFYAKRNRDGILEPVTEPIVGEKYFEFAVVAGGTIEEEKPKQYKQILLEIPIPLCSKHNNNGTPFVVNTCNGWNYLCLPSPLGSTTCRLCKSDLSQPMPYLSNADLKYANLSNADLKYAKYDKYTLGLTKAQKEIMIYIE